MASYYGNNVKIQLFGQSHSSAIGVTVDGLPAGKRIDFDELQLFMNRRAPGKNAYSTARQEADVPEFLCGLVGDRTCGAPLTAIIHNNDAHSKDYAAIRDVPRPSHADYPAQVKFDGAQDVAGGGHFSGRLTAPLCLAGGICKQILEQEGISIFAHILSIADENDIPFDRVYVGERERKILSDWTNLASGSSRSSAMKGPKESVKSEFRFPVLDETAAKKMQEAIAIAKAEGDSVGGIIECAVTGMQNGGAKKDNALPVGLGSPMFGGMENKIAQIVFGVPAVKGIEFGAGFSVAQMRGSECNDQYCVCDGRVCTKTNNNGGILGGLTNGMPLIFSVAVKPTPSIAQEQDSVCLSDMKETKLVVQGRHDPCIVPRAVPVIEAAAAIAVFDALLEAQ